MVHAILEIVKGVAKVPGDTLSSEVGLDSIDLLDPMGFSVDSYVMEIPNLKGGAVWADSPLTDGRTLISGAFDNVKETIRLNLTASTMVQMAAMLSKLGRMRRDANNFWDEFGQIEPVYVKHQMIGEPGPRYALLYDMDIAITPPQVEENKPIREVILVIERESGWRGLAPGDNPKHWSYIANDQAQQWRFGKTSLVTGEDHLVYFDTGVNRAGLATGSTGYLRQNFFDIDAEDIPGDLPALVNINIAPNGTSTAPTTVLMGKRTKKTTGNIARTTGVNQLSILTFNAADGSVGTDTTLANDTGASAPIGGGTAQRSQTTFASANMLTRLTWTGNIYTNGLNLSVMRGRYAVFVRARNSAAATCNLQLLFNQGSLSASTFITTPVVLTDLGGGGTSNSTDWAILYMGEVTLPINRRTEVGNSGLGVFVDSGSTGAISIQASRTSGAGVLYINDLIFIPVDEGAVRISSTVLVTTGAAWNYDNTGYYSHGHTDDFADIVDSAGSSAKEQDVPEVGGAGITLTPGVVNRIYFLMYVNSTKRSHPADPSAMRIRVNIVPRWSGLRDV